MNNTSCDIGIITVIGVELQALQDSLGISEKDEISSGGSLFWHKYMTSSGTNVSVVIHCVGDAGNESAASATSTLIAKFHPKMVILMGIAAGIRGACKIGEVFVPRVIAHEGTKAQIEGELRGRPEIFSPPHAINQMLV